MKIIRYKFLSAEISHGTEEKPNMEQIILDVEIICPTQAVYDASYLIAEREAVPGSIEVVGELEEETGMPSLEDRVGNLETDTEDLAEALEMILNGVTE